MRSALLAPLAFGLSMCLAPAEPATAQDEPERVREILHADLPLFAPPAPNVWPKQFADSSDGSFGCTSPVGFGDWIVREPGAADDDNTEWFRIANYGVFHCWLNVAMASDRERLADAEVRPSFFVMLERRAGRELWALQLGARPGSDYILLRRTITPGVIASFDVLQRDCSGSEQRDRGGLDILLTRYCSVASASRLRAIARRMAKMPAVAKMTRVTGEAPSQP